MRVKIGNVVYDSRSIAMCVELSDEEHADRDNKKRITRMPDTGYPLTDAQKQDLELWKEFPKSVKKKSSVSSPESTSSVSMDDMDREK